MLLSVHAGGQQPPPGWEEWTSQTYTLAAGESMPFRVDWDQIPVRRWLLLVEGDLQVSYLNLRRERDRSLVYDLRDESRHMVEIPWGEGESITGLLRAERAGAYAISLWGPPRDNYLRAYSYGVNRALEALEEDDRVGARAHLLTALQDDPADVVAQTLMLGLDGRRRLDAVDRAALDGEADPDALRHLDAVRERAAELRGEGLYLAAADTLHQTIAPQLGAAGVALIYADLADLYLDLGNPVQAQAALAAAESLGLAEDTASRLRKRLADEAE